MKKIHFLAVLLILAFTANAQVSFGVKGGLNLADWSQDFTDTQDEWPTKFRLAPNIGLVVDYGISDNFTLRSGLLYNSKGTSLDLKELFSDLPDLKVSGYSRFIVNYLEVPVSGAFNVGPVTISAGPYVAFGLNGIEKWDYEISGGGDTFADNGSEKAEFSNEDISGNDKWEIKGFDYGVNLGVEYPVDPVTIGLYYGKGFANMTPSDPQDATYDPDSEKVTNSVISFSVTYFFNK